MDRSLRLIWRASESTFNANVYNFLFCSICSCLGSNHLAKSVLDRKRLKIKMMMKTVADITITLAYVNPIVDFSARFSSLRMTNWYLVVKRSDRVFFCFKPANFAKIRYSG